MENKTVRRLSVLDKILQPVQFRKCSTNAKNSQTTINEKYNVEISSPPADLGTEFKILFTEESLTFVSELFLKFDQRIDQLYWTRWHNRIYYNTNNTQLPKFLNTAQRNDLQWKINPLPKNLTCRQIDLGDVSPANTDHFLRSLIVDGIQGVQVDFDDGHCPNWRNQIKGLYNVYSVVHNLIKNVPKIDDLPVLMLRPRAWNMIEHNIMINGKKVPGPIVDFAILMYHNANLLSENGNGPFLYLSKLEGASEAKLWNDIFIWTQEHLNIPQGTIKACVLIENILSSFQLDEILFELKEHSLGLNCGIWDYAASIISKFGDRQAFILPDRNKYVNMDKHFLKKYMEYVINVCHIRGAPATGGMAAHILTENNNQDFVQKVLVAKRKEIEAGCDGFLIYDPKLVPYVNQLWNSKILQKQYNFSIQEKDLLIMPKGTVTQQGLNHNIAVAILFIYNWFQGNGHFSYKGFVEDSATAEISRSQIWQWIRHEATIEDNRIKITKRLIEELSANFIKECVDVNDYDMNILITSKEMFLDIVTARYFVEFITTYLNDNICFRQNTQIK